jgi:hypothetical protein
MTCFWETMSADEFKPRRRGAALVVTELGDETVVYDLERDRALCLDRVASATWRRCDGQSEVVTIASTVSADLGERIDREVIWFALRRLDRASLLAAPLPVEEPARKLSRRAALRRLAAAGALTAGLPTVLSVLAPSALQAQGSCQKSGQPCGHGNNFCCAGPDACVGGRCI